MKGQFEFTAPCGKTAVSSSDAILKEDRWEQSLQQNNTPIRTPKHPSAVYESNFVQHFNIFPNLRDNRFSPGARRNEEVIVSFKFVSDHMDRISSLNMETLATGCDETNTLFHLCQCSKSRLGTNAGSNWVKGKKRAATTVCLCAANQSRQASTPAFPMTSTTRSTGSSGSSSEDEDNPSSQCHQFPKLPFPPPCLGLQGSHLNPSEDDSASEAEEGWMFSGIQKLKQDQSLGSGLQQHSFSSSSNRDDGHFNMYLTYIQV